MFTQHTNDLYDVIGLSSLRQNAARTRERIEGSPFTKGVREAMSDFFARLRADLDQAGRQGAEIHDLMRAMYTRFAHENRLDIYVPPQFSVLKYLKEIERMERAYNTHFNTLWNMVSKAKYPLMKQFFETVASRARHVYKVANRDVEGWLKAVMSPLETQVREDAINLYGFADKNERDWFRLLTTVQGVGAKVGLAILGVLSPDDLSLAIAAQDKAAITRAPAHLASWIA